MSWQKKDAGMGWLKIKAIMALSTIWGGVICYYLYMIYTNQRKSRPDWFLRPSRRRDVE